MMSVLVLQVVERVLQMRADFERVLLDVLFVDDFERRQALRHADRVAAERVEVDAVLHHFGDADRRRHRAERRAVADALGHRDHVGHDAPILVGPVVMAGAAEAALHFVGDADAAVLADDVVDDFEELLRRRDRAADALNRLADEAGDLARRFVLDHVLDVVRTLHAAATDTRAQTGSGSSSRRSVWWMFVPLFALELPRAVRREAHRHRRAAVVAVAQRDHVLVARVLAGREDRDLVRLAAAVGEVRLRVSPAGIFSASFSANCTIVGCR